MIQEPPRRESDSTLVPLSAAFSPLISEGSIPRRWRRSVWARQRCSQYPAPWGEFILLFNVLQRLFFNAFVPLGKR